MEQGSFPKEVLGHDVTGCAELYSQIVSLELGAAGALWCCPYPVCQMLLDQWGKPVRELF